MSIQLTDEQEQRAEKMYKQWLKKKKKPGACKLATSLKFQEMIRIESADEFGVCTCVTCGKKDLWNSGAIHAGHFVAGRNNVTLFCEDNCNPQCAKCNTYQGGKLAEYTLYLADKLGRARVDRLLLMRFETKHISKQEFARMRVHYMDRIKKRKSELENGLYMDPV